MLERAMIAALLFSASAATAATDLVFFAVSDQHYGQDGGKWDSIRSRTVDILNSLPLENYPEEAGGGLVGTPRGVIIPGDLIDLPLEEYWSQYAADYGVNGEGRLKFPVFDALGNHDVWDYRNAIPAYNIRQSMVKRNQQRLNLTGYNEEFLHYSWDWDDVHFVNLNLFAGNEMGVSPWDPLKSLDFLKSDLEKNVGSSGRPVMVVQHFPYDTLQSYVRVSHKVEAIRILKNYNCIGILHGHTHQMKIYNYDGLDIFDDGTALNGDLLVFRIKGGRMTVVSRVGDNWVGTVFEKSISLGPPLKPRNSASDGYFDFSVQGVGSVFSFKSEVAGVEIHDASGRHIRTLAVASGSVEWDRIDQFGRPANLGLYFARISSLKGDHKVARFILK